MAKLDEIVQPKFNRKFYASRKTLAVNFTALSRKI